MQAAVNTNTRQFGFNRVGTTMMALGAAGSTVIDRLPSIGTSEQAIVLPKAHTSVNQGEGMLAGTSPITAAVRAHTAVNQGEGIVGGNLAVAAPLMSHASLGQGEGIVGGLGSNAVLTTPVGAHYSSGMGEGWTADGRPDATIRAHAAAGQGEGWVSTGRP